MTVYIEYAFLENFLFDGVLLSLALFASKTKIRLLKLIFASALGGVFALVFPLLSLPVFFSSLLKISVGFLLCLVSFGRVKTKKEWGRYALTAGLFFFFTFAFGGALTGVYDGFLSGGGEAEGVPAWFVFCGFSLLTFAVLLLIRKIYQKRGLHAFIYPCEASFGGKTVRAEGYLDSGNLATKNGLPVCFLSPDLLYDLYADENGFCGEQVCDELVLTTVAGEKKTPLYKGELRIKTEEGICKIEEVYFAAAANIIGREYKLILNVKTLEKRDKGR